MPGLARPPRTSCSASTTSVLPAPVSPVSAVMPGPEDERQVLDHAEVAHVQVGQHGGALDALLAAVGQQPEAQDAAEGLGLVAHDPHRVARPPCR